MPLIDDTTVLAAGTTSRRSTEVRFSEVKNVRDFGAVGNGVTDDSAAIQSAIDWSINDNRGVIFFPEGDYIITEPLIYNAVANNSIIFRGTGRGSRIRGNFVGFLLDHEDIVTSNPGLVIIENLHIWNSSADAESGGIRWMAGVGVTIRNCLISGHRGIHCSGTFGVSIENCVFQGTGAGGLELGSIAIYVWGGGGVNIHNCDIVGYHDGIQLQSGAFIHACRFELNGNGIHCMPSSGGAVVGNCTFEANDCSVYLDGSYYNTIIGGGGHGHSACFYSGYGAGGTGPLPEADPENSTTLWSTYGIFVNDFSAYNTFINCVTIGEFNVAAIRIENGQAASPGNTWIGCFIQNSGSSLTGSTTKWSIGGPNNGGHKFISCIPMVDPVFVFADLPATEAAGRSKGVRYCITDGGAQAVGAVVSAGGGSTFMEVMWNGTAWTRCA